MIGCAIEGMTRPSSRPAGVMRLREDAKAIFLAGVAAADPERAMERALRVQDHRLEILLDPATSSSTVRSEPWHRVRVVAFGKAACAMSRAALRLIPADRLVSECIVVTNYENVDHVPRMRVIGAGHPLPDANGLMGARLIADQMNKARSDELVLVLISGGGSALLPYPPDSISLDEKIAATELLLACGAPIEQINTVRKHLSVLKGGGLARLAAPASVQALILSDVIGDDLSAIASGPTAPDLSTYAEALEILVSKGMWQRLARSIQVHLQKGRAGELSETPKPGDPVFAKVVNTLVGSNAMSLETVKDAASRAGYSVRVVSKALCGEARDQAETFITTAVDHCDSYAEQPLALVAGGETTVTLHGPGRGGRNQELALAFAIAAQQYRLPEPWAFLSGGTDGRDGPTDAAGGVVDPWTLERIRNAGGEPAELLEANDSYHALSLSEDLLFTGATGTNVADLQVLLIGFGQ